MAPDESEPPGTHPAEIGELIQRARAGDKHAHNDLCELLLPRVMGLIKKKASQKLSDASAEDVLQNVFASFCKRFNQGKFPKLDSDSVWPLLARMTVRKVVDHYRRKTAKFRGREFARKSIDDLSVLSELVSGEVDPAYQEELEDMIAQLLSLCTPRQVQVFQDRLEGRTIAEIAQSLDLGARTVEGHWDSVRKKCLTYCKDQGWDESFFA
jgi:RNA polymerase sigma factor (sigma-70 family)